MLLALGLFVLLVPACGKRKVKEEPEGPAAIPTEGEDILLKAEDEAKLRKEFGGVMYRRLYDQAQALRDAQEYERALETVQEALRYNPTADEAITLRNEIQLMLGNRAGESRTILDDHWEAFKAKQEEQKVAVRAYLAKAERARTAGDFEAAKRSYERAVFIVTTSKYAPLGEDDEIVSLGQQAESGLADIERKAAEVAAEREREDTAAALLRVAEEEEKALMEARDRRARLLSAAIDRFNLERFDEAETYAEQVLAEEPDNTVAREIVENSQRARHTYMGESMLRGLKDSFRRWQVDIDRSKVPSSAILKWPSQTFWDRISRLRAVRDAGFAGPEMSPEEQGVLNTLKSRQIDLPFDSTPFPEVVNFLTAASGVNFVIDARAKEDLEAAEISLQATNVTVEDALSLIMLQASAEGEVVWEIRGNIVRFIKKEHQKRLMVLRIHPVADLTLGLTDFIPPQITQVGVDEDSEVPLFGGQAEEAPQPYGTIEELLELVRTSVAVETWDDMGGTITAQGKNLVVYNTPKAQQEVTQFLDDLRAFAGLVVTIESRFLTVTDAFLRDVGVDFRGLGGTNGGPLAVLDDVTSGLDDNASAALDNSGPGVGSGGAALAPSSGFFFNDGADGDFRGRNENIFSTPLGQMLSALGGGTFAVTYIDDFAVGMILRATEKADIRELTAPSLTVYNTQRANLTVVNQISFVQDFDVEVAQTAFIADPVIGVIQDGLTLDVRPTVSNDRQYITLELRPTIADLVVPIATFQTLLGASISIFAAQNPVTIQLPEVDMRIAESTVRIPDGGSILLGGLKDIDIQDMKSTSPILGDIPILSFLFSRQGKSQEIEHLMIVVTATITDLQEQALRMRGS
jgi:general secretion pathway protein D